MKADDEQDGLLGLLSSWDRVFSAANAENVLESFLLGGSMLKPLISAGSCSVQGRWYRRDHKGGGKKREYFFFSYPASKSGHVSIYFHFGK